MKDKRLFNEKIFSPEFLMKLKRFHNTTRAITIIAGGWGGCTIDEAEDFLKEIKVELMKTEKEDEYSPEYAGDRTFAMDVDEIIEGLRDIVRSLREETVPAL